MNRFRQRAAVAVMLCLGAGTGAAAQNVADYDYENLSFRGIGFDIGRVWPNKVLATETYSVRVDLGFLGPAVRVTPMASFWTSTMKTSELERLAAQLSRLPALQDRGVTITGAELGEIDWSNLTLGIDANVVWTLPFQVFTYAGAGLGLHFLNGEGTAVGSTFIEDLLDTVTAGGAVMAGAEVPFSPSFRLYGEVRYTLLSDVRYPGLRIGGAFMLPSRERVEGTQGGQ